ncbi:MAG: hypothetical protein V4738_12410, partial [Pseudomonadota bacterium]
MTETRRPRRWRQALLLGAVLAVITGAVIGTWFRPAPTTQTAPVATTPPQLEAVATVQTVATAPVSEPAPNTDATPSRLTEPPDALDLSRLRTRALTLPVTGVSAAQLSDTYTQARAAGAPHEAI